MKYYQDITPDQTKVMRLFHITLMGVLGLLSIIFILI
jgi:hypothetical protein